MKRDFNKVTIGQDIELTKIATIFSNEKSKQKGFFPKDKEFQTKDIFRLIFSPRIIVPTLSSVFRTPRIIRKHNPDRVKSKKITKQQFNELDNYIRDTLKMDSWGVATLAEQDVFRHQGIPFKYALVLSQNMNKDKFHPKDLPNMDCQLEVMRVYGNTGIASLKVTKLLRKWGYAAAPNHSLGGNVDYTKTAMQANIGFIGKHGMLITPENGPCNRLSVVYIDIENINDFLNNDIDFSWGYDFCKSCKKCVRSCPENAIYEENIIDEFGNVESISNEKCNSGFKTYGCGICIAVCPFTQVGYKKLFAIKQKRKGKSK